MGFVRRQTGRSALSIWSDIIRSSLTYNTSILEYFNFHFYQISETEKADYAGTGYMYEYQLAMNPQGSRTVLSDKLIFLDRYAPYIRHQYASLQELENDDRKARAILANSSGKVVLKSSDGQCGRGIEVKSSAELTPDTLIERLKTTGNDFVEAFVVQHPDLMRLSPAGLNTIRVITQVKTGQKVDILGARLRITINAPVDNLAAGNIAAPIDLDTGRVTGPGVYSDITKADEIRHPVTGVQIVGFQVPFWSETIRMCREAALLDTTNRSIGWDVAITADGPELIEGNHDWCKLLWQLPVKKGLKSVLEKYKQELSS